MTSLHGGDVYQNKVQIDFSINVNPMGMPENVKQSLMAAVERAGIYPDIKSGELYKKLSINTGFSKENLVLGNGASELLSWIINMINPRKILMAVPSFVGYRKICESLSDCTIISHILNASDSFSVDESFAEKITEDIDAIILTNPNNPTGRLIDAKVLSLILKKAKETNTYLIIDECFIDLTDKDKTICFSKKREAVSGMFFDKLIVVNAFTKTYAIPGVRLGYAICADKEFAERLKNALPEWNISVFAQDAGVACLMDNERYLEASKKLIKKEKAYLHEELTHLGYKVFDSDANYVLIKETKDVSIYDYLLEQGILIRDCENYDGLERGYYRIAVKCHEDNVRLIDAIKCCENYIDL